MPHTAHRRSLLQEAAAAEDASHAAVHIESSDTMLSRKVSMSSTTRPHRNRRYIPGYHSTEISCTSEKIEHQNVHERHSSNASTYTSEADFHKPGIYGSVRVWANAWDVFRRTPSRDGRGRRAAVDFVVCFGWGGFFCVSFFRLVFFFERTRTAASMRPLCLTHLFTSNKTVCTFKAKKPHH